MLVAFDLCRSQYVKKTPIFLKIIPSSSLAIIVVGKQIDSYLD